MYTFLGRTGPWLISEARAQAALAAGHIRDYAMPNGKRRITHRNYAENMLGAPRSDNWDDIKFGPGNRERTGFQTQKPLAVAERAIRVSSNPGDVVFDPFAGSGTTLIAAERLGRQWVGCEIDNLGGAAMQERLQRKANTELLQGAGAGVTFTGNPPTRTDAAPTPLPANGFITPEHIKVGYRAVAFPKGDAKDLMVAKYGCNCWGCNRAKDVEDLQVDHDAPRNPANGGERGPDALPNYNLLCGRCNRWKGNRYTLAQTQAEWGYAANGGAIDMQAVRDWQRQVAAAR